MGVFSGGYGESGQAIMKSPEPCHPDYEQIINRLTQHKAASKMLQQALENYIEVNGKGSSPFTLPSLIGELCLEIKDFEKGIASAIKEQEKLAEKK